MPQFFHFGGNPVAVYGLFVAFGILVELPLVVVA
jgi:prolipoprotein diacylglyceryltransferase